MKTKFDEMTQSVLEKNFKDAHPANDPIWDRPDIRDNPQFQRLKAELGKPHIYPD